MKNKIPLVEVVNRMPDDVRKAIKGEIDVKGEVIIRSVTETPSVKDINDSKRSATIYLSTRHVDHAGDVVTPFGWELKWYNMNPKGLWSHDSKLPPIYMAEWSKADDLGLMQKIIFDDSTQLANDMWSLFSKGFIKTFSAGFRAARSGQIIKGDENFSDNLKQLSEKWPELRATGDKVERIIADKMLFESSLVNIPCNPYAMVVSINKGDVKIADETRQVLKIEEIIQKGVDGGFITKDNATGGTSYVLVGEQKSDDADKIASKLKDKSDKSFEEEPIITQVPQIKVIDRPVSVRVILTKSSMAELVEKNMKKVIAKRRGSV